MDWRGIFKYSWDIAIQGLADFISGDWTGKSAKQKVDERYAKKADEQNQSPGTAKNPAQNTPQIQPQTIAIVGGVLLLIILLRR